FHNSRETLTIPVEFVSVASTIRRQNVLPSFFTCFPHLPGHSKQRTKTSSVSSNWRIELYELLSTEVSAAIRRRLPDREYECCSRPEERSRDRAQKGDKFELHGTMVPVRTA